MISIDSRVKLNNNVEMPCLGLGIYLAGSGKEAQNAIQYSLKEGYRLIDTAKIYGNERDVGIAIMESKIPREEIFVTTKLWNSDHGYDKTLKAFDESLKKLDLDYIDLYLIHWPVENVRKESWRAMEKIYFNGRCRAIGVSNYTISHLAELLDCADVVPTVNQVEFSPFLYQEDLLDFCHSQNIKLEAYSPLTRGKKFKHPTIQAISKKYSKTPAQILLRWALQHDVIVIPKSVNKNRIKDNANIFDFSILRDDMKVLNSLNEDFRVSWDPTGVR